MIEDIKKIASDNSKQKKVFAVAVVLVIILSILLLIASNFGTFDNVIVKKNKNSIFSISDLTVNNLKFSDNEKKIIKELGKPKKEKKFTSDIYSYKTLYYDGLELTLKENYNEYMLVKAEITSRKYTTSRNIKVKDRILKVIKKYRVDNKMGTYLYGNYSTNALDSESIKENIFLGVRSTSEVVYINRDAIVDDAKPNIARLNISYKFGKVSKITWSYDIK